MSDAQAALAQVREALAAMRGDWLGDGFTKLRRSQIVAVLDEQAAEIERLTDENGRLRADLLAGRNVVNAGLTIHTLTIERDMLRQEIERLTAALRAQPGPVSLDDVEWAGKVHLAEAIRERDELRRQLAEAELDAERYRWLRKIARQNTAYDVYKDGAHWSVGLHSDDRRQTFDQAIDAAMGLTRQTEES